MLPIIAMVLLVGPARAQQVSPSFETVSIRRNTNQAIPLAVRFAPDGAFAMTNTPVSQIVQQAFGPLADWQVAGLRDWMHTERYDVAATADPSVRSPTPEQRQAMVRGMLTERFKMQAHFEMRDLTVYNLVVARRDGRLGPQIKPIQEDCDAIRAAAVAAAKAAGTPLAPPPPTGPIPTCFARSLNRRWEGDIRFEQIASRLQLMLRRPVVDKTGLSGYYHIDFAYRYEPLSIAAQATNADADGASLFSLVQDQLGLKLQAAEGPVRVLVIDRLERPTEN